MSSLILVVDDEPDLLDTLDYSLRKEGYRTRTAGTGRAALDAAEKEAPDLVILDLMLPDISGTEVCRRLRAAAATREVPIVMLTARGEEIDRVVGFEVGADDYVVKPFSVRELLLRVSAILRRGHGVEPPEEVIAFGVLRLDRGRHEVWVADQPVGPTALEFELLATLLERRGRVQSREVLLADVWGTEVSVTARTVDTHVKRLREKLGVAGAYIETVRGVGYRFRERPDQETE
jgi:two-component system phosphate regulon response regulator PhoB